MFICLYFEWYLRYRYCLIISCSITEKRILTLSLRQWKTQSCPPVKQTFWSIGTILGSGLWNHHKPWYLAPMHMNGQRSITNWLKRYQNVTTLWGSAIKQQVMGVAIELFKTCRTPVWWAPPTQYFTDRMPFNQCPTNSVKSLNANHVTDYYFWLLLNLPVFPEITPGYIGPLHSSSKEEPSGFWCTFLYRPDALYVTQPTVSKQRTWLSVGIKTCLTWMWVCLRIWWASQNNSTCSVVHTAGRVVVIVN